MKTRRNPLSEESSIDEIQYALGSGYLNHDEYKRLIDLWNKKHTPPEAFDPLKGFSPKKKKETEKEKETAAGAAA